MVTFSFNKNEDSPIMVDRFVSSIYANTYRPDKMWPRKDPSEKTDAFKEYHLLARDGKALMDTLNWYEEGHDYEQAYRYMKIVAFSQLRSALNMSFLTLSDIRAHVNNARSLEHSHSDDLELAEGEIQRGIIFLRQRALFPATFLEDRDVELFDTDDRTYKSISVTLRNHKHALMPSIEDQATIVLSGLYPENAEDPIWFGTERIAPMCESLAPDLAKFRPGWQVEGAVEGGTPRPSKRRPVVRQKEKTTVDPNIRLIRYGSQARS